MPEVSVWNKIMRGFESRLATLPSVPPIQSPNVSYSPVKGTLYLRSSLLPAQTVSGAIGTNGTDFYQGVYQVDVFAPRGEGSKEAIDMADDIIELFVKGSVITTDLFRVRIENGWIESASETPDWYQIPITIGWFSSGNN